MLRVTRRDGLNLCVSVCVLMMGGLNGGKARCATPPADTEWFYIRFSLLSLRRGKQTFETCQIFQMQEVEIFHNLNSLLQSELLQLHTVDYAEVIMNNSSVIVRALLGGCREGGESRS